MQVLTAKPQWRLEYDIHIKAILVIRDIANRTKQGILVTHHKARLLRCNVHGKRFSRHEREVVCADLFRPSAAHEGIGGHRTVVHVNAQRQGNVVFVGRSPFDGDFKTES